jgi:hypothetical protein
MIGCQYFESLHDRGAASGNMVMIAVISPQQILKLAINYMTHPIH